MTRDQRIYCEQVDRHGPEPLHALQNLTAADLDMIQEGLSRRRAIATIRMEDKDTPLHIVSRLRVETERLDLLCRAIQTQHHHREHVPAANG